MKRKKNLLILSLVAIVLLGTLLLLNRLNKEEDEEETAEALTTVYSVNSADVTRLSWTTEGVSFSFSRTEEGWTYDGDSSFPVDSELLDDMAYDMSGITSTKFISDVTDLAEYGLAEPVCEITVTTDEERTFTFGSTTAVDSKQYCSDGSTTVYLVGTGHATSFGSDLYAYVLEETVPDMSVVRRMTVTTEERTMKVVYKSSDADEADWYLDRGSLRTALDSDNAEAWIATLTAISFDTCVNYNAEDCLAQYGLEEPVVIAVVSYTDEDGNGAEFSVELGAGEEGGCYARITGSNMVYSVDSDIAVTLLAVTPEGLYPAADSAEE